MSLTIRSQNRGILAKIKIVRTKKKTLSLTNIKEGIYKIKKRKDRTNWKTTSNRHRFNKHSNNS